jgi:hypothetical protein
MEEYKIHIKPDLSEDYSIIIQEYWEIVDNDFPNRPKQICQKYNITIGELNKIIKDYSCCNIVHGYCSGCGVVIEDKVYSQTSFREKKRRYIKERCNDCEIAFYKEREAERVRQQDEEKQQIEERFSQAIQEKRWNNLSDEELEILKGIVRIKNKSLIYKEIFNDDPFDKSIWRKVGNIEKKGLLCVKRNSYKSVIEFHFPEQLEQILLRDNKDIINEELDFLSFSLSKYINKTQIRQPDYSGTFILKRPVRLVANVKYIYGGWINTDGSINIKIQPLDNIVQKVEHGTIENEPTHIKNIMNEFFNYIDKDDAEE